MQKRIDNLCRDLEETAGMKNRALFCTVLIAAMLISCCTFSGCKDKNGSNNHNYPLENKIQDDKYRNWYEIFVWSFSDSDGDGIGDLKGLESKLDYVAEMGFNGIWLMPVMPSPSYHKYDVTDYYAIDHPYAFQDLVHTVSYFVPNRPSSLARPSLIFSVSVQKLTRR